MKSKTTLDIIEKFLDKKGKSHFDSLVELLKNERTYEITNAHKAKIFTHMNIDKRFIHLGENVWDLRTKHSYSKVHLPINKIYEIQKSKEEIVKTKLDSEIKSFVEKES